MADDGTPEGKDGEGKDGSDQFDPKTLSTEAQEFIRKSIQSESDSKSALAEKRLRDEVANKARSAVESAEDNELNKLAEAGDDAGLGARVRERIGRRSVEERAITRASDAIERQMSAAFSESLGPENVEQIRQQVVKDGGAHAEFAAALAKAESGKTRSEEIQAEVKAALLEAGVKVRDAEPGTGKPVKAGQGAPPSTFEEKQQAYVDGTLIGGSEAYAAAVEARSKGQ